MAFIARNQVTVKSGTKLEWVIERSGQANAPIAVQIELTVMPDGSPCMQYIPAGFPTGFDLGVNPEDSSQILLGRLVLLPGAFVSLNEYDVHFHALFTVNEINGDEATLYYEVPPIGEGSDGVINRSDGVYTELAMG